MMESKILRRRRKEGSRTKTLDFIKSRLVDLVGRIPWEESLKGKGGELAFQELLMTQKQMILMQQKNGKCHRRPTWLNITLFESKLKNQKFGHSGREANTNITWACKKKKLGRPRHILKCNWQGT